MDEINKYNFCHNSIYILRGLKHADEYARMKKAIEECDNSEDAPIVAFVSKMVCVSRHYFNERNLLSVQEMGAE